MLIHRYTHPLLSLLPDLTEVPLRRQIIGALVASVILHLLALLALVFAAGLLPTPQLSFARPQAQAQELQLVLPEPEPLEMQIVQPEDLLQARQEKPTIDSTGLAKSDEAPADAVFESDENMKAASELPASGDAPLPTVDGKVRPFTNFATQDVVLGAPTLEPAPEAPPTVKHAPATVAAKLHKPQPVPREQIEPTAPAQPETAPPPPLPEVQVPSEHEIALAQKAKLTPQPRLAIPAPRPVPTPAPVEMAKLTPPARAQPGFRAQQEQTRIEGSITNRGKAAVDAAKTPLGVYKRQVNSAIGSRWYYYVREQRDLIAFGSVKVSYAVTSGGKIVDVQVVSNTSNEALANICKRSIREAEIGPPPEEAQASMSRDRLEFDLNFTYYDQH